MKVRATLNKLNFALGRNPEIEIKIDWRRFIPNPYKAVLLISADFELAWAWQYAKNANENLAVALDKARWERTNIPELVKLCDEYSIPLTWATVGHLFLESCAKTDLHHSGLPRLPFFQNEFWKYSEGDWFQNDPGSNYKAAPEWYCPDLIRLIRDAKTKHEIGCHTFSHIDCRDQVCPSEVIRAELLECKQIARGWGMELKSFVHPGHTIGNLDVLAEEGFTSFRTDYRNVLGYPQRHINGLWEFEQTAEISYRKEWSLDYHIYRYITIIKRAIKANTVCVLWFHPSFDPAVVDKILPKMFRFIDENKDFILVPTMTDYSDWLSAQC